MTTHRYLGELLVRAGVVDAAGMARVISLPAIEPRSLGRALASAGESTPDHEDELVDPTTLAKDVRLPPIVKLVNLVLSDAAKAGASDVHIEPHDGAMQVRHRCVRRRRDDDASTARTDEDALVMLIEILPTGFECGALNGTPNRGYGRQCRCRPDWADGAAHRAVLFAAILMIDLDVNRLAVAKQLGVDVVIEAVGVPATFNICRAGVLRHGVNATCSATPLRVAPTVRT